MILFGNSSFKALDNPLRTTKSFIEVISNDEKMHTYKELNDAISFAGANSPSSVYIINDYELKQDLNIPAGVEVIVGNGNLESYTPRNQVKTFGNLTVNAKLTVNGKLYVLPWVDASDGKAKKTSDVKTRNITVGSKGSIVVQGEGEYRDCTKISGAPIQVFDYVNYPVSYSNVRTTNPKTSESAISTYTGWRVVSNYVDDNDEKIVKIITAGIPETITINASDVVESNLQFAHTCTDPDGPGQVYEIISIKEKYKSKYFNSTYANSYKLFGAEEADIMHDSIGCNNDLILNGGYYFSNTVGQTWNMETNEKPLTPVLTMPTKCNQAVTDGVILGTSGVRPCVSLKTELKVYKIYDSSGENYKWEFVN